MAKHLVLVEQALISGEIIKLELPADFPFTINLQQLKQDTIFAVQQFDNMIIFWVWFKDQENIYRLRVADNLQQDWLTKNVLAIHHHIAVEGIEPSREIRDKANEKAFAYDPKLATTSRFTFFIQNSDTNACP